MAENIIIDKVVGKSGASNSNATAQSQSVQSTVRRQRKKRSPAWDHFDQIIDSEGNQKGVYVAKSQSKLAFQPVLMGNKGDIAVVPWKFDQEQCRKALCRMVIIDELPFSFVEKEGYMNFMKVAQYFFRIPSRRTVTRDCFDLFNEEKRKLMKLFKDQRVCLTTDT
ncbi:uncharacterized protein [Nicotiana tomentosiformis]|uniref:uncharacterized protein n=1 Tax=Nicotiana tomentosiformis TaxID=4098 RepID=UPI00388C7B49